MRTTRSSGVTKILPSPIWPVFALALIASIGGLDNFASDRHFDFELGQKAHRIFGAAIDLRVALLPAIAFDLGDGHALNAEAERASRTSSSLNGLMIAVMSFMDDPSPWGPLALHQEPCRAVQVGEISIIH